MLYIVKDHDSDSQWHEYFINEIWHVGDMEPRAAEFISEVTQVQADGDELDFIRKQFKNLPDTNRAVVCWFGDHAKFIVAHLGRI